MSIYVKYSAKQRRFTTYCVIRIKECQHDFIKFAVSGNLSYLVTVIGLYYITNNAFEQLCVIVQLLFDFYTSISAVFFFDKPSTLNLGEPSCDVSICHRNHVKITEQVFNSPNQRGITQHPWSSSINLYILIFFSETTCPVGTKFGRNIHWMVPYKVNVFC